MKTKFTLIAFLLLVTSSITAQFSLDGEFRPRTEYRNGFGDLKTEAQEVGIGTSTRVRLNAKYKGEGFTTYLSLQDVFVFGENRQLLQADANNSLSIFEAWANIELGETYAAKLGRQMVSYDDQRILGAVGWAQQARTHDALLFKHKSDAITFDIGLAYNQDYSNPSGFVNTGNTYNTTGFFSYKTMQYVWANKKWNNLEASVLFLNNGFQKFEGTAGNGTYDLQTFGTHLKTKLGKVAIAANLYGQTGQTPSGVGVKSAYLLGADAKLPVGEKVTLGAGLELISGDDSSTTETEAFFPVYGTNHKFNGYMDYFYVGNHAYSVGLNDFHINAKYAINPKSAIYASALYFTSNTDLPSGENYLGTELDLVYSYKLKPEVQLHAGYSQMFAGEGMEELKGVTAPQDLQNWAWAMITIKPKFLN